MSIFDGGKERICIIKADFEIRNIGWSNIEEANQGQSKADFIHKLSISLKEAVETNYWLRLLRDSEYLTEPQSESLLSDCSELEKLLTSSIKTAKTGSN